ncbi:hypothetical protein [Pacificibacter marinus]|uniref:DUF927 domain-containing protein n=1 Tax=Pacificibacter marinus TaxID=658057 RepID=A0A1Y5T630_9RHOB|nr:hypothetical protein [Pacificibacter marinus]SEL00357.1 hypothetical protein SAMN04488032_109142 [Pacificibacter marinus]SLN54757.1 hypothetical protein PAM7971_02833 [Pacificibacter marinus]
MKHSDKFLDAEKVTVDQETLDLAQQNMDEAVNAEADAAMKMRDAWISARAKDMPDVPEAVAIETLERAIDDQVLSGAFVLSLRCPKTGSLRHHSVSEVLTNTGAFDGWDALDPIDINSSEAKVSGKLRLKGKAPHLDSFSSGACRYRLQKDIDAHEAKRVAVEVSRCDPASTVDRCVEALAGAGKFYMSGQTVLTISNGASRPLSVSRLDYELSRIVAPYAAVETKGFETQKSVQLSPRSLNQIHELLIDHLPKLSAVVYHPVLRPDGTLIKSAGYDAATGVYVNNGVSRFPKIETEFDPERIEELVKTCLKPFREYRFADHRKGRTAMLAAVLTAVLRPAMETAPMIAVTSPEIGVGKSFIAQALGIIATGDLPKMKSVERSNSSEMRKLLFADLLEQNPVMVYDNMDGAFRNEVLTSFITTPVWSDRVLGESRTGGSIRNTALLVTNGVNMSFPRGMSRRYLLIDLRPPCDNHITADFGFTPHGEAKLHRPDIIAAALGIAVAARPETHYGRTLGSFETWTRLVRDPILHLMREVPDIHLCDPLDLFVEAMSNAVDDEIYRTFLEKLFKHVGGEEFEADQARTVIAEKVDIKDLVFEISTSEPTLSNRSVAAILGKLRGLNLNGVRLTSKKRAGRNLWKIEGLE